ncbi:MAG: hypothetical protein FWD77_04525 [Betaproteobacteria bacterium]|nr:hypothetical protein [Betaproteobacteria bacterium]
MIAPLIIARLRAQAQLLKGIGGAAEFSLASETRPAALPSVYVVPLAETPRANELAPVVMQRVEVSVGLVIAVSNVADKRGAAALGDLGYIRAAVHEALYAWAPEGFEPLERGPGNLLGLRNGVLWWQDIFNSAHYLKGH